MLRVHREDERICNFRAGLVAAAIYNVAAAGTKRHKFLSPLDFFERRASKQAMDPAELLKNFEHFQQDFYAAKKQGRFKKKR